MAIISESAGVLPDGTKLVRFSSDAGKMILQNETGNVYISAIDVENAGYTYSETEVQL